MGIADVKCHIEGPSNKKLAKGMESQSRLSFRSSKDPIKQKVSILYLVADYLFV